MKLHSKYPHLFNSGKIGNMLLKNHIVQGPSELEASGFNGEFTDDFIDFYEASAKGGTGLIITAYASVDDEFSQSYAGAQLKVTDPKQVSMLSKLARRVHKYDTKIFVQCYMAGRQAIPTAITGKRVVAPSAIGFGHGSDLTHDQIPEEMTLDEIKGAVQKFIKAAKLLESAGIDGIEVLAAGGYLINEFLSPYSNIRTDDYGGSFENRTRLPREVIEGIRTACSKDFIVGVRMCANEFLEEGYDLEEGARIAKFFEACGVDYINLNNGNQEKPYYNMEPIGFHTGWKSYIIRKIKSSVSVPVIATNVIKKPEQAEQFLAEGLMDYAEMTRAFFADRDWSRKAYECRSGEIKPCIGCLHCTDAIYTYKRAICAVNPTMLRISEFPKQEQDMAGRKIIVVGAGPAGMEAAIGCAQRGADVTVYDKRNVIGGAAELGSRTLDKKPLKMLVDYYGCMAKKLDINVKLNIEATADMLVKQQPYAVFIATGAGYYGLPGIEPDGKHVLTLNHVLINNMKFDGEHVVVIGGGMNAVELAEYAAANGGEVSIIARRKLLAPGLQRDLIVTALENFKKFNVKQRLGYKILGMDETGVLTENSDTGEALHVDADKIILCVTATPECTLYEQLEDELDKVIPIGDCIKVGRVADAIRTGYEKAYVLE